MSAAPSPPLRLSARLALLAGLLILGALWLGPLREMSRTAFSAHMLMHLGVVSVAAPLLAIALVSFDRVRRMAPVVALSAALALAIDIVVVWGWHTPGLHAAAARNEALFALQQLSFLVAGLVVWITALRDSNGKSLLLGIVTMLLTFSHMAMLGVLLALSPELLYAPELCIGAFGFSQLEDQQLGGVLMATLGGLPHLFAGLVLTYRLMAPAPPVRGFQP